MSYRDRPTLLATLGAFLIVLAECAWYGLWAYVLWNMFMPALGIMPISWPLASGLILTVEALQGFPTVSSAVLLSEQYGAGAKTFSLALVLPPTVALLGWLIATFWL